LVEIEPGRIGGDGESESRVVYGSLQPGPSRRNNARGDRRSVPSGTTNTNIERSTKVADGQNQSWTKFGAWLVNVDLLYI
jgi:hypothetical protein